MLICLNQLNLFIVLNGTYTPNVRSVLDAVTYILVNSLNGHSTAIVVCASGIIGGRQASHLIIIPWRGQHNIGHLSRWRDAVICIHYVFDNPSNLTQRLSFLVITARWRRIRLGIVISLSWLEDHSTRAIVLGSGLVATNLSRY
jgi:hypothetical protein